MKYALLCIFLCTISIYAQFLDMDALIQDNSIDSETLQQTLEWYLDHPVNLNLADQPTLARFPLLCDLWIDSLLSERNSGGLFSNKNNFLKRMKLSDSQWAMIESYVTFAIPHSGEKQFTGKASSLITRKTSESEKLSLFPILRSENRRKGILALAYSNRCFFKGILESDPGEPVFPDHRSWYFTINLTQKIHITTGAFQVSSGYGLVLSEPFSKSAGQRLSDSSWPSIRIKGFASGYESGYLQGVCVDCDLSFRCALFASRTPIDAALDSTGQITSIQTTGLHISDAQRQNKHQSSETLMGIAMTFEKSGSHVGFTGWLSRLDHPVVNNDTERQYFDFSGNGYRVGGLEYALKLGKLRFGGESAICHTGAMASFHEIRFSAKTLTWLASWLYLPARYQNNHSNNPVSSQTHNINSLYTGVRYRFKKSDLSFWITTIRHPWRTYFVPMPSDKQECFFSFHIRPRKKLHVTGQLRLKTWAEACDGVSDSFLPAVGIQEARRSRFRLDWQFCPDSRWQIKYRIELCKYRQPAVAGDYYFSEIRESGILMSSTVSYRTTHGWHFIGHWQQHGTDSFDSAIYQYEYDLPGLMTINSYYSEGARWYVRVQLKKKRGQICVKYGMRNEPSNPIQDIGIQTEFYF